jgi:thiosulfate/3-mercaptopyruvate sulfurtransferase
LPIVAVSELAKHLDSDDTVIVDCRFDLTAPARGESQYLEAHIPGAIYAHLERDLSAPKTGRNGRHPLPSPEAMSECFSSWGIDGGVGVVAYDAGPGQVAARLWWMLRFLGHGRVQVLDGGFNAWKDASLPVRGGQERRAPRRFDAHPHAEMHIDLVGLVAERDEHFLIDARDPARYRGDDEPLDPVAGHIPGARNHFWQRNLDERGYFLPPERLRNEYGSLLADAPCEHTVVYCGSGVTACHNLISLELAGFHGAKLYPGSWSEWCADPECPVETGDE